MGMRMNMPRLFVSLLLMLAPVVLLGQQANGDAAGVSVARDAGQVWRVGSQRRFRLPSEVVPHVRDGDTVEIDAGTYRNDYATWTQNGITLRGIGGMAHLKSSGLIPNGKAIWVIDGHDVLIENIEFSGASVRNTNGAGIRHQGGRLTLRNTFFHDNEFSILSGKLPEADILVTDSRFWHQKRPIRHSHGIYIGRARSLRLIGNHFTGTSKGHQVKSRALHNLIAYNRIEDTEGGDSSRLIDLPNCGYSIVLGNELHQAATSDNFNAIGYGPEGCGHRDARHRQLYVAHNTFINEAPWGELVRNFAQGEVLVANNLVFGAGTYLHGAGSEKGNVRLSLGRAPADRWSVVADARIVDQALDLSAIEGGALLPERTFSAPVGTRVRPFDGKVDVGSNEFP
jgi:hypothetical protein